MGFTSALFREGTTYNADSNLGQSLTKSSLEQRLQASYNQQLQQMHVQSRPQYHYRESDVERCLYDEPRCLYDEPMKPIINNKKSNKVQEDIDICSRTLR